MMKTLEDLAEFYNTDKSNKYHNYIPVYQFWINNRMVKSLLEIGFGKGASMRMWQEYFNLFPKWYPKTKLYCIEYSEGLEHSEKWKNPNLQIENVEVIEGDSTKVFTWDIMPNDLDIIVDDGSHYPEDQITSFLLGFKKLASKGLWFIEDTHCGFTEKFGSTKLLYNWLSDLQVKQQLPNMNAPGDFYASRDMLDGISQDIYAIHSYKSMIVIEKG